MQLSILENITIMKPHLNMTLIAQFWGLALIIVVIFLVAILVWKLGDLREISNQFKNFKKNSSAKILTLKTELETLKTENEAFQQKIKELKKEDVNKVEKITQLEQTIETLQTKIEALTDLKKEISDDIVIEYYTDRKSKK